MTKRKTKTAGFPKFANEREEADWWASAAGREFVRERSADPRSRASGGSKLVAKLAKDAAASAMV